MHLWTDLDAPFSCTEISISRRAKSNRDLHIKTCGECDTLTNSMLLHQCKIQYKWAKLHWQVLSLTGSSRSRGTLKLLIQGVRHYWSSNAKFSTFMLFWGMKNSGNQMSLLTVQPLIWWQVPPKAFGLVGIAWKRLITPSLPQTPCSPCQGRSCIARWLAKMSSKALLAHQGNSGPK